VREADHAEGRRGGGRFLFPQLAARTLSAEAFANGQVKSSQNYVPNKSNVFKLYEENIGPLTPLLSDMLREAEKGLSGRVDRGSVRDRRQPQRAELEVRRGDFEALEGKRKR
jgi:hypothetical protein